MWPFSSSILPRSEPIQSKLYTPGHHNEQPFSLTVQPIDYSNGSLSSTTAERQTGTPAHEEPRTFSEAIRSPGQRFGLQPVIRSGIFALSAFFIGFSLGVKRGSKIAGYRYRAENAHHLPTSPAGWFLYNKSKNYHVMLGGIKEGIKFGGRLTAWVTMFALLEEGLDRGRARLLADKDGEPARGQKDVLSTVSSALTLAGSYSWLKGFNHWDITRTVRLTLKFAIPFGVAQDILSCARGDRPAYIDWFMKRTFDKRRTESTLAM